MQPAKLDVFVAFFCYGGNGGVAMVLPEISSWWARTFAEMKADPRIGRIDSMRFGDVPLTMERNRAVLSAKENKSDIIVMVDSDNSPDLYLGAKEWAKPFWQTSFDFLYERKMRGLPSVVCAPYCGPPPHPTRGGYENVYVFFGEGSESENLDSGFRFEAYSREHASQMRGIQSIVAGPTGLIVYTLDAFDLMPVHKQTQREILTDFQQGKISIDRAARLLNMQSWFFYEYTDGYQTRKASTEDVTNTREIQMAGVLAHKEPVVFCNWDSWAGHWKPKCVGMPEPIFVEQITENYKEAVERNLSNQDELVEIDYTMPGDDVAPTHNYATDPGTPVPEDDPAHEDMAPGLPVTQRMVGGRLVYTVGNMTNTDDLNALTEIVSMVADSRPEQPLRVVEVGSWVGESALAIYEGFGRAGGEIYCVDTWEGSQTDRTGEWALQIGNETLFSYFKKNVGDLLDKVIRAVKSDSVTFANSMEPQDLDLAFIDAGHSKPECLADLEAWFPHLKRSGVMCGHDWDPSFPGVAEAVMEFCNRAGIKPKIVNNSRMWMFLKSEYLEGLARKEKRKGARPKQQEPVPDDSAVATE